MDIEKLIEQLRTESLYADKASLEIMDLCMEAATALSTLQAENEKLREMYQKEKSVCHAVQTELEQLKKGNCAGCSVPAVKTEQIKDLNDAPKLRAENLELRAEKARWFQINQVMNDQVDSLEEDNKQLRAELEQVKNERDSARATLHWVEMLGQKED